GEDHSVAVVAAEAVAPALHFTPGHVESSTKPAPREVGTMIGLSRFRRAGADGIVIALILLASLAVPACDETRGCTLIGCPGQGLDIVFDGSVAPDATLEIEIALVEQQNVAPVIHCTLSGAANPDAGTEDLFCNSNFWTSQHGRTLNT